MILRSVFRFFFKKVVLKYNERYYSKPRNLKIMGFDITINPIVYHNCYIENTKFLADTIITEKLSDKYVLEIGNTCGLISLFAAKKGANVNVLSVANIVSDQLKSIFKHHDFNITFHHSLIECSSLNKKYDFIIINQPRINAEEDWEKFSYEFSDNYEYYKKLFEEIHSLMHSRSVTWLCIDKSEPHEVYNLLAQKHGLHMDLIGERSFLMFDILMFKIYPVKN